MSRSRKKTQICGHGNGSEKQDKRLANRRLRKKNKQKIQSIEDLDEFDENSLSMMKEVSNVWSFVKDGKSYYGNIKDEEYVEELDRK